MVRAESSVERQRRAWVEWQESFKDRSELFEQQRIAAETPEERRALEETFASERTAHRQADVASGRRPPDLAIMMRQCMWAVWIEIAVQHELDAREHYRNVVQSGDVRFVGDELRASLVAVIASVSTVEAVYGELKYLIPVQERTDKQYQTLRNAFAAAFGLDEPAKQRLSRQLQTLFEFRDSAVHPYTEMSLAVPHPSGTNSSAEAAQFNAINSRTAVDTALAVLAIAAAPTRPFNRWVERSEELLRESLPTPPWPTKTAERRLRTSHSAIDTRSRLMQLSEPVPLMRARVSRCTCVRVGAAQLASAANFFRVAKDLAYEDGHVLQR